LLPTSQYFAWHRILKLKFEQNPTLLQQLRDTGTTLLIEFNRGAARQPDKAYWNGMMGTDGQVIGKNIMGRTLMAVRKDLAIQE
jgi:predicted NAD-dependent protein-ADP-ribosyltransferase YbiA (DUF1768 family)